ncbi:MAG: hypothetical protein ACKOGJ_03425 [Phycisphaerales bacterium]
MRNSPISPRLSIAALRAAERILPKRRGLAQPGGKQRGNRETR